MSYVTWYVHMWICSVSHLCHTLCHILCNTWHVCMNTLSHTWHSSCMYCVVCHTLSCMSSVVCHTLGCLSCLVCHTLGGMSHTKAHIVCHTLCHIWRVCMSTLCNTWHIHMCNIMPHRTYSYAHMNMSCMIFLYLCMTHLYVQQYAAAVVCVNTLLRVTWLIHTWRCCSHTWSMHRCDMIIWYVWHDSFVCVTWCMMMRSHVWRDAVVCRNTLLCVTWLIYTWRCCSHTWSTHRCDYLVCVTWLIRMCDAMHDDASVCATWCSRT